MKLTNFFVLTLSVCVAVVFFNACSNDEEQISSEETNSKEELLEKYHDLLANTKPYISEGMQALIDRLDTATVAVPIEELLPNVEELFEEGALAIEPQEALTRSVSLIVDTGCDNKEFLFENKAVTISDTNSSFKASLNYGSTISGNLYLSALAVTKTIAFYEEPISLFYASTRSGDRIGVKPSSIDINSVNNDTSCKLGYSVDEISAGELYTLTTYLFVLSDAKDKSQGIILPYVSDSYIYETLMEYYCETLEWTYYIVY